MFEKELGKKLQKIFDVGRITFDAPSTTPEQGKMYVEIENVRAKVASPRQLARVTGRLRFFAESQDLPYGYFARRIAEANESDRIDFFFFGIEENASRFANIVERSAGFVFFYQGEYDPDTGELTSINFV